MLPTILNGTKKTWLPPVVVSIPLPNYTLNYPGSNDDSDAALAS